jgi:hypothetical protein
MTSFGRLFLYCLVLRACVLLLSSECTNCLSPNLVFHIYMLFSLPYVARMTFNICDVDTTRWGAWAALGWRAVTLTSLHFTSLHSQRRHPPSFQALWPQVHKRSTSYLLNESDFKLSLTVKAVRSSPIRNGTTEAGGVGDVISFGDSFCHW